MKRDGESWIVDLVAGDAPKVEAVGNKFSALSRFAPHVPVPPALCLTTAALRDAMTSEMESAISRFFEDTHTTVGCFLLDAFPALDDVMRRLTLGSEQSAALDEAMHRVFGDPGDRRFAVRSSAVGEDSRLQSFAGIYESRLDVRGRAALEAAVVDCWRSFYAYPAVVARLRAGDSSPLPRIAVIIQEMVEARLAGVAFSAEREGDRVRVEYVEGLAEKLVLGIEPGAAFHEGDEVRSDGRHRAHDSVLREVVALARRLQSHAGGPVDVEWVWDGDRVQVVQVRPITAARRPELSGEPYFRTVDLYFETDLPPDVELGECRDVYVSYVGKRASAYRAAAEAGVAVARGWLLSFNRSGLRAHQEEAAAILAQGESDRMVVDLSASLRQLVLEKDAVVPWLLETFDRGGEPARRHAAILRDFVRGELGFLSRMLDDGRLLVECSRDGLLSLNRGLTRGDRLLVSFTDGEAPEVEGGTEIEATFGPVVGQISDFTKRMHRQHPGILLEWVMERGRPYFVDFSLTEARLEVIEGAGDAVCVSGGIASGPALVLDDRELLERLSVGPAVSVGKSADVGLNTSLRRVLAQVQSAEHPPIVIVDKPYAVLSVLFDFVAGFVFREGSLLCHLGILLRENRIPGIIDPVVSVRTGQRVMLAGGRASSLEI